MSIQNEITKLNGAQRDMLRRVVGGGAIEALTVTSLGWKKRVEVAMYGHRQTLEVGPRGALISREVL